VTRRSSRRADPAPRWRRRPDERTRALTESALKLLMERGYRRIRLEDVADDAGVSKATVYHYFANKDELLTQTIAGRMAEKHDEAERRLAARGGSAAARLQMLLRQFWDLSLTRQAGLWQQMLAAEIATGAPDVFAAWARGLVRRWRVVRRLIREGQRTGEFRRDVNAEVAARMVISALSHQALFHVHFGLDRFAPYSPDRLISAVIQQFIDGLRAPVKARGRSRRSQIS
jgi:AcrR family transcriptional regulator